MNAHRIRDEHEAEVRAIYAAALVAAAKRRSK